MIDFKKNEKTSIWTFLKLKESTNWIDWSRSMKFALLRSDLWNNVSDKRKHLDETKESEKIDKWDIRNVKARGKIDFMCVINI